MIRYKVGTPHRRKKKVPQLGDPGNYKVCFIDGHDLKYKTFTCWAEGRKQAIEKMFNTYGPDFDHQVKDVFRKEG